MLELARLRSAPLPVRAYRCRRRIQLQAACASPGDKNGIVAQSRLDRVGTAALVIQSLPSEPVMVSLPVLPMK